MHQSVVTVGLLVAMTFLHTTYCRTVIQPGGTFTKQCLLSVEGVNETDLIVQFYRDKTEVKMFGTISSSFFLTVISNNSEVNPSITNATHRYSVTKGNSSFYQMEINDLIDSDSAWYGCRIYNKIEDAIAITEESKELQVPGPLRDAFWTTKFLPLNTTIAEENKVENGTVVLIDNDGLHPGLFCLVLVANVEPRVNITIGQFGEVGSVDITKQFKTRTEARVVVSDVGVQYRFAVYFMKEAPFQQTSIRNLHCSSSLYTKSFYSGIHVQIKSKPANVTCQPTDFWVRKGSRNVTLTCLVPVHPYAKVNWVIPGGIQVNESSPQPGYTVTNEEQFDGVFSTLTIAKVGASDFVTQWFYLEVQNSEGSGQMYLRLRKLAKPPNVACQPRDFWVSEGTENVTLTCLVPVDPNARVNWVIPGGIQVNESSPWPGYTVTNEEQFDGIFSALTIAEVRSDDFDMEWFYLDVENSEGSGQMYLRLLKQEPSGASHTIKLIGGTLLSMLGLLLVTVQE